MGRTDENNLGVIGPANVQGCRMSGPNRRPLSNVNRNVAGVSPYPCAVNKKGLNEKHVVCGIKNQVIPAHRPVTRKFAAQLANATAQPKMSNPDCSVVDVEDYMSGDSSVPMYVKHTEAMMDEIDLMEEVEMEDAVMDIDRDDSANPLAVVEYIDDIYSYYKRTENLSCVFPNYMAHQYDINEKMRAILVDWLIEVHYKFELMDETLFLTVNLIDRFLERQAINRKKLQLVGVTALLLACKYEEVSVPIVDDLIVISDRANTREEILNMEKLILNKLQFNMSVPTPYVFMRRFLKAAQSDRKLELLSFYMIELSLVEHEMLKYPPSMLAAAAIYTAQCVATKSRQWSKTCIWHTTYTEDDLLECAKRMVRFHEKAGTGKLTGVHKKYISPKFSCAAKLEPAHFLLEN